MLIDPVPVADAMQRAKRPKGVHILADFSYYIFHVMFIHQIFQCIIGFHAGVVLKKLQR